MIFILEMVKRLPGIKLPGRRFFKLFQPHFAFSRKMGFFIMDL